ncbi:MAG: FAD synthetase family protein, partial [Defluviitaleaceae bacterium]|nr:FAD synthetase family protein [Defluviitaleaceae bacterium]
MKHITSRHINYPAEAVALGNFDGLHRGHQELIRTAKESGNATVFSFFPPPSSVVGGAPVKAIMTSEEKAFLLEKMGVEHFIEYPFDEEIADMSPENFVRDILARQLCCKTVVVGEDYRFGQRGRGDCELLRTLGGELGFELKVIP